MSIPGSANPLLLASAAVAGGYEIERSLRFNSADSAYLSRTPASSGNRKTWTWSGWVKRSKGGGRQGLFGSVPSGSVYTFLEFDATNSLIFYDSVSGGIGRQTSAVFQDYSAFMHIVLAVDTTAATADSRISLYLNGSKITAFVSSANPALNADTQVNASQLHVIGSELPALGSYFDGYLAECIFVDGTAHDATAFGEFDANNVWQPKAYSGTYGTNGFHLDFADNSNNTATTLGKDTSGNGNNWTPNNLSVTAGPGNDSLVDSPTNYGMDTGVGGEVRGNYCTLNPLDKAPFPSAITVSNGNLEQVAGGETLSATKGTISVSSGKWYWEVTVDTLSSGGVSPRVGIVATNTAQTYQGNGSNEWVMYMTSYSGYGGRVNNGASLVGSDNPFANGDVGMFAVDMDNKKLFCGKNGVWANSGNPVAGTGFFFDNLPSSIAPLVNTGYSSKVTCNFGQRPFAYTAPSGFKALCTANLP